MCNFAYIYLSGDPLLKYGKTFDPSREFHNYLKRAQVVGSFGIEVQFDDDYVLLDGATMGDNQANCFIKARQGKSFKDMLPEKPLHRVYV